MTASQLGETVAAWITDTMNRTLVPPEVAFALNDLVTLAERAEAAEAAEMRLQQVVTLAERVIAVLDRDDRHGNLEMHQEDALGAYWAGIAALAEVPS